MSDQYIGYKAVGKTHRHAIINHIRHWVHGNIHTNTIENFWSLFKRGVIGSFHKVSAKHLPRYLAEFTYRFNNRNTADLFLRTVKNLTEGTTLTYARLVSK